MSNIDMLRHAWVNCIFSLSDITVEEVYDIFDDVINHYQEPHRYYHNTDHLSYMINKMLEHNATPHSIFAAFYHDYYYDPKRTDNEWRSAKKAIEVASKLNIKNISSISYMIILTQHNYPSTDPEAQLLLDCDLIAMADPTLYAYNGANIRKEYSHVPDDAFYKGRAEFLQKLLDKDKILYILDGEDDIRFNIGRERGYE